MYEIDRFKINGVEVSGKEYQEWLNLIADTTDKFVDVIKEKQKKKIKVGDLVKVVNSKKCYTSYATWVFDNVDGFAKCQYAYGKECYNEMMGRVITLGKHPRTDKILCYIKHQVGGECAGNECYLMSIDGLEKVEED